MDDVLAGINAVPVAVYVYFNSVSEVVEVADRNSAEYILDGVHCVFAGLDVDKFRSYLRNLSYAERLLEDIAVEYLSCAFGFDLVCAEVVVERVVGEYVAYYRFRYFPCVLTVFVADISVDVVYRH